MKRAQGLLLTLLPLCVGAFLVPSCEKRMPPLRRASFVGTLLPAKNQNDDEDENQAGMQKAFQELDALKSLDDAPKRTTPPKSTNTTPIIDDDNVNIITPQPKASPEQEVKLYKDMMSESEQQDDVELYADVLSEMGGTAPKPSTPTIKIEEEERVELLDSLQKSPQDLDVFMNQALQEALEEAKTKSPQDIGNPLDDKEMMDEIKQVFDKANDELLASLEDIRKEQAELARASAQENSQARMDAQAENEERMAVAQASMEKMLQKVNTETLEVEKAVQDLKLAQEELSNDPLYKLKNGGIVKQASLVGTALFSVRAMTEVAAMMAGPNGDAHLVPALIQGAIALVCAAYLFLV